MFAAHERYDLGRLCLHAAIRVRRKDYGALPILLALSTQCQLDGWHESVVGKFDEMASFVSNLWGQRLDR